MRHSAVDSLRGIGDGASASLKLLSYETEKAQVIEGALKTPDGAWYPILKGVPCFLSGPLRPDFSKFAQKHNLPLPPAERMRRETEEQVRTSETFSDKWRRYKTYGFEPSHQDFLFGWYCKKLGLPDVAALKAYYRGFGRVLEVGPGSGFNTRFIAENCEGEVFALDISDAALTTFDNTRDLANCTVVQADLMNAPFADDFFDFVIADGVLHHTPDTRKAIEALYRKVKPGGHFFFYVYKKMGPARQFCDQYIREHFRKLTPDRCYATCEALTELGRELSRLKATITLTKPIDILGIPSGTHDVQRLIYYNFLKCFWNEAFDYETNNMVNFDWYHPMTAWQHSEAEVRGWLAELSVTEYRSTDANPNGISILLKKPKK